MPKMNKLILVKKLEDIATMFNLPENLELRFSTIELVVRNDDTQKPVYPFLMGLDKAYKARFIGLLEAQANMQVDITKEGFYA